MGWSLRLGEIAGIRVQVHFTFAIFMAWIVLSGLIEGKSPQVVLANASFVLGLFGCVVLHELGHAVTAKRYGIRTKDITLLPIGGVARLERMPDDPRQELWVALAGPAVNVAIAAALWVWFQVTRGGPNLAGINLTSGTFLERILLVNISLVVFNILPAFPMDGGRIVRALLATRMEYTRASDSDRGEPRSRHGDLLGSSRLLLQSDVGVHRHFRLDRRRARVQHGADEIRLRWNTGECGDDEQFPDGGA